MIAEICFFILLGFLGMRIMVSLANWITRPRLEKGTCSDEPLVSILIPARNEAHNLPRLLDSILLQGHSKFEVIVLDDQSTDPTADVVEEFSRRDVRIQLRSGTPLPSGWLGKNWACQQLAATATGEYLLFVDADVQLHPGSVVSALAEMQRNRLHLLSLFPEQEMRTSGERSVVPIMHYLLMTLLPLRLVQGSRRSSLAAANGQFMLFDAKGYRAHQWHERFRASIVEDIAIMRGVKRAGQRGSVLLGNGFVTCRMYGNYWEGVRGFSKNLLAGFNDSISGLAVFLVLTLVGYLALIPWLSLGQLLLMLGMVLALRLVQSAASGQSIVYNLILHPVQMSTMLLVGARSVIQKLRGNRSWKGRLVDL